MAAALSGKALPASKLLRISNFLDGCQRRYLAMDEDVPINQVMVAINTIAGSLRSRYICRLPIPPGKKDPGALSFQETVRWLTDVRSDRD